MSTVNDHISRQPVIFQKRFSQEQRWLDWTNDLLEELSGEGIMPLINFERGVEVKNGVWITKPTGLRRVKKLYAPLSSDTVYTWEDVEGKLRIGHEITEQTDTFEITAFSAQATDSITVNLAGYDADDFEDFLLVIDSGTLTGKTYVLEGNDASGATTTKLLFLHDLTPPLTAGQAITGRLIDPSYYLMLKYAGSYEEVTAATDSLPIDTGYDRRITEAWFRWKCERASTRTPDDALPFYQAFRDIVAQIKAEIKSNIGGPIAGRRLVGYE